MGKKYKEKVEWQKKWRKIKNRFKINKLFYMLFKIYFTYFSSSK